MIKTGIPILCIVGARPNFPKVAPLMAELQKHSLFQPYLLHTGQHYDAAMSKIFFDDLKIPKPDKDLGVGSGSHAWQTAEIIKKFEPVLEELQPQCVIVVGDVNSTIACSIVAAKFQLETPFLWGKQSRNRPVIIHVEAGLRSFDNDMPEEINRKLTDAISDILFVSDPSGMINLKNEGVSDDFVFYVGNVMIDTLLKAKQRALKTTILTDLSLTAKEYILLTLHRPSNVDDPIVFSEILSALNDISKDVPIVFPVHPRTRLKIAEYGIKLSRKHWVLLEPAGYLEFINLEANAALVVTDSGGIQEETTVLGVPCMTVRDSTERPVTVTEGTNVLVSPKRSSILSAYMRQKKKEVGGIPKFWDGKAAERIVSTLDSFFVGE